MEKLLQFFAEAPPDRLGLLLCVFFILLLVAAIGVLWKRIVAHEKELEEIGKLQRRLLTILFRRSLKSTDHTDSAKSADKKRGKR